MADEETTPVHIGRIIAFVGQLLGGLSLSLSSDIIHDLLDSCSSKLAFVRVRSMQVIEAILSHSGSTALSSELCDSLVRTLSERLNDKDAKARKAAVLAISSLLNLKNTADSSKSLVGSLVECLSVERTLGVRSCIVSSLPIPISILIERTLDVSSEVRAAAYARLKGANPCDLTPHIVASLIVRGGSKDEDPSVRSQLRGLVIHWTSRSMFISEEQEDAVEGFISFLLSGDDLDLEVALEAVNTLLDSLVESDAFDCAAKMRQMLSDISVESRPSTIRKAAELAALTDRPLSISITPARAIFWRFLCSSVRSSASALSRQAASITGASSASLAGQASSLNDLLESFIPESASQAFAVILGLANPNGSRSSWMAAKELMEIVATSFDWTDLPSRQAARDAIDSLALVSCPAMPSSWTTSLVKTLVSVQGGGGDGNCTQNPSPLALSTLLHLAAQLVGAHGVNRDSLHSNMDADQIRNLSQVLTLASHSFYIASAVQTLHEDKGCLESLLDTSLASMDLNNKDIQLVAVNALSSAALVPSLKETRLKSIVSSLVSAFGSAKEKQGSVSTSTRIACDAASGLTHLVLCYGQEIDCVTADQGGPSVVTMLLDACHTSMPLSSASDSILLERLTECLAKMIVHQELQSQMTTRVASIPQEKKQLPFHLELSLSKQVLATLLLISVHPTVADELPKVGDILRATWQELFTRSTMSNTGRLMQAAFSAICLASTIETGSGKSASNLAPLVIKKLAQLLDLSDRILATRSDRSPEDDGRGTLALQILLSLSQSSSQSHPGMKFGDVEKELGKLLCLLTPSGQTEQRTIRACLILIERIGQQSQIDASAAALIQSKVKANFEEAEEPGEIEVEIEEMLKQLSLNMPDVSPAVVCAIKKKAVRKAPALKKKQVVESDADESDEQDDVLDEDQERPVPKDEGKGRARPRARTIALGLPA